MLRDEEKQLSRQVKVRAILRLIRNLYLIADPYLPCYRCCCSVPSCCISRQPSVFELIVL